MPRATNTSQLIAQANQDDEFYTPREMIEAELTHYDTALFRGKKILCNCDDPKISEFYKYFKAQFHFFGLRRLITTCYKNQNAELISKHDKEFAVSVEYDGVKENTRFLQRDGDFRSPESIELLQKADIVCTNPPFSKWREFIAMMTKSKKKFIVIGNLNAVGYKEVFPLIQGGKIWLGAANCKGAFIRPGGGESKLGFAVWYTNLPHARRDRDEIPLVAKYTAKKYPRYDNYPAIEVRRVEDIPADYDGEMGVPRSFIEKHNPRQFEIVGKMRFPRPGWDKVPDLRIRGRMTADRLLIRRAGASADWKECKDLTRRSIFGNAGGFVYVAVVRGEEGFKIGKTNTTVADRVKRDAFHSESPKVVMALEVANAGMAEKQIHDALASYRKTGTEFFNPKREYLEQELTRLAQKPIRLWR